MLAKRACICFYVVDGGGFSPCPSMIQIVHTNSFCLLELTKMPLLSFPQTVPTDDVKTSVSPPVTLNLEEPVKTITM